MGWILSIIYKPMLSRILRHFKYLVTENIEMRLCRDQHRSSGKSVEDVESIYVENLEVYVW